MLGQGSMAMFSHHYSIEYSYLDNQDVDAKYVAFPLEMLGSGSIAAFLLHIDQFQTVQHVNNPYVHACVHNKSLG